MPRYFRIAQITCVPLAVTVVSLMATNAPAQDEAAKFQQQSRKNLERLALAMYAAKCNNPEFNSYEIDCGHVPPIAICSKKDGKALLSWRVAILPYLKEGALYEKFKLDEPWDSPSNIKLLPMMPKVYAGPGVMTKVPHATFYQVVGGSGTAFEAIPDDKTPLGARGIKLSQITDGTSNTIGIVEALEPVPWSKPADLAYGEKKALKLGGVFQHGFHVAFMDTRVEFLSKKIDEAIVRGFVPRASGLERPEYEKFLIR